jgi:hypothetical protein
MAFVRLFATKARRHEESQKNRFVENRCAIINLISGV